MAAIASARARGLLALRVADATPGACEFYDGSRGPHCAIHRDLGAARKPAVCRHFPRLALLDPRGVSLSLSHYCPTAASMLFRDSIPLRIVHDAPAFPPGDEYEGLDARDVMPPLLRPGMLWDYDGYTVWEEEAIGLLARADVTPETALERLAEAARAIERWSPGDGPLAGSVRLVFSEIGAQAPRAAASHWGVNARVVNRYLAARLFASWVPYRAQRLSDLVQDLDRAHALLREESRRSGLLEGIRAADLRIVHAGG